MVDVTAKPSSHEQQRWWRPIRPLGHCGYCLKPSGNLGNQDLSGQVFGRIQHLWPKRCAVSQQSLGPLRRRPVEAKHHRGCYLFGPTPQANRGCAFGCRRHPLSPCTPAEHHAFANLARCQGTIAQTLPERERQVIEVWRNHRDALRRLPILRREAPEDSIVCRGSHWSASPEVCPASRR